MTRYIAVSRRAMENWVPPAVPHAIISITTPCDRLAEFATNEHTLDVLRLAFHDLDREPRGSFRINYGESVLFNEEMARKVVDFGEKWIGKLERGFFQVHCDMGASRSTAVAAALAARYDEPQQSHQFFRSACPNMRVYRMLVNMMDEDIIAARAHDQEA